MCEIASVVAVVALFQEPPFPNNYYIQTQESVPKFQRGFVFCRAKFLENYNLEWTNKF